MTLANSISRMPGRLRMVVRGHAWFLFAVMIYVGTLATVGYASGGRLTMSLSLYWYVFLIATLCFAGVFVLGRLTYTAVCVRPKRLFAHIGHDFRSNLLTPQRFFAALPIMLALPVFMSMFSSFKSLIPAVQPFAWDATFADWDQALHFGRQPWEWLQPLFGHPYVTTVLNFFYNLWFFVLYAVWMWQAFATRDPLLRMRYFLSFVLVWGILGTGMAVLFSSAGPCYFGRVTGLADPYTDLFAYLRMADEQFSPVWSLRIQEMLWTDYLEPGVKLGSGISAMPSMHVATAVLFALLGWKTRRWLGIALTAYAVLIGLGSVHLGWHYAVDGYVSIIATLSIWKAVGWFLARDRFFDRAVASPAPA
jgi:hypothetical protein